jgi:hypothetical protein
MFNSTKFGGSKGDTSDASEPRRLRFSRGDKAKDAATRISDNDAIEKDKDTKDLNLTSSHTATDKDAPKNGHSDPAKIETPMVPPVSFISMFRCSSLPSLSFHVVILMIAQILNEIGVVLGPHWFDRSCSRWCSTSLFPILVLFFFLNTTSHASQPLMSLIFGNLIQDFVTFGLVLGQSQAGNSTGAAKLPEAAANFRRAAALDALHLVFIGVFFRSVISRSDW